MKKQKKYAFTLIELLVAIAIISIIILWTSNINFNKISDKQKLEWFFYKIKTNIETVANNALIWKAIKFPDNSISVPRKWKIDFNNSNSGIIQTYYYDWINYNIYNENNITTNNFNSINTSCESFNEVYNKKLTDTWSIIIEWWKLSFTWSSDCLQGQKILKIETKYKNFSKTFTINTISGVIEEK